MESHQIKCVLLADRHQGLSEGVRGLLEAAFDAVLMAADAKSLLEGAERLQPALAVVDLTLSRSDSLDVIRQLRSRSPLSKVIVLSMHGEPSTKRAAFAAGAHGYVLKSTIAKDLTPAVDAVLAGGTYGSPEISGKIPREGEN
jgi:DNA-binding NarL/FixJ family response regulator